MFICKKPESGILRPFLNLLSYIDELRTLDDFYARKTPVISDQTMDKPVTISNQLSVCRAPTSDFHRSDIPDYEDLEYSTRSMTTLHPTVVKLSLLFSILFV